MKSLLSVILAAACTPALAASSVPERFQGEWNIRLDHCGTALNDSTVKIGRNRIQFFESSGDISAAVTRGRQLALIAVVNGEGSTSLTTSNYRLSKNQSTLVDEMSQVTLKRCPVQRARTG